MTFQNPFFHRGAIRKSADFYNRTSEVSQILGLLRNGQSVSIIGPRRIGKSSLLLHLTHSDIRAQAGLESPNALFIVIDCQLLGGSPADEIYESIYTEILDAAEDAGLALKLPEQAATYRALDRVLHALHRQDVNIVIMLDEFELLAANEQLTPYFFARLRGLTTKYGIAYITASQHPLYAITADEDILSSPFFNIFVTMPLGQFSNSDSRSLLIDRMNTVKAMFTDEQLDFLVSLVGQHPFFLQVAGYHAYQFLLDKKERPFSAVDTPIEMELDSHLSYLWDNLNTEQQYSLATRSGNIDTIRHLTQQCLLAENDAGLTYTSQALSRFIRRQTVEGLIQTDAFVIDPHQHLVSSAEGEIKLTNSQFALLVRLCQEPEQVVHYEQLERAVWGEVLFDEPDRLKTLIKRLRQAIAPYDKWVVSERGVGYAFRAPDVA